MTRGIEAGRGMKIRTWRKRTEWVGGKGWRKDRRGEEEKEEERKRRRKKSRKGNGRNRSFLCISSLLLVVSEGQKSREFVDTVNIEQPHVTQRRQKMASKNGGYWRYIHKVNEHKFSFINWNKLRCLKLKGKNLNRGDSEYLSWCPYVLLTCALYMFLSVIMYTDTQCNRLPLGWFKC